MAKLTNSVLLMALCLFIATTSVANSQSVQVIGRGLTCSNPSPPIFPFPPRPLLVGATARLTCDNGATIIATATTNANGDFTMNISPVPLFPLFFPIPCRVFLTLPASCALVGLFGQPVTVLRSGPPIYPVLGQPNVYQAVRFSSL